MNRRNFIQSAVAALTIFLTPRKWLTANEGVRKFYRFTWQPMPKHRTVYSLTPVPAVEPFAVLMIGGGELWYRTKEGGEWQKVTQPQRRSQSGSEAIG